jgi:hypothetical protein
MEVERERLKLRDAKLLSPPTVDPAWQCGKAVVIRGFVANAALDVEVPAPWLSPGSPVGFL